MTNGSLAETPDPYASTGPIIREPKPEAPLEEGTEKVQPQRVYLPLVSR